MKFELRRYSTAAGRVPYSEWLDALDGRSVGRITAFVDRMETGIFGDSRQVGKGVLELKINFGPGFRVYYLREGQAMVLLLLGGDKSSQHSDIPKAHGYAKDHRRRQ